VLDGSRVVGARASREILQSFMDFSPSSRVTGLAKGSVRGGDRYLEGFRAAYSNLPFNEPRPNLSRYNVPARAAEGSRFARYRRATERTDAALTPQEASRATGSTEYAAQGKDACGMARDCDPHIQALMVGSATEAAY